MAELGPAETPKEMLGLLSEAQIELEDDLDDPVLCSAVASSNGAADSRTVFVQRLPFGEE